MSGEVHAATAASERAREHASDLDAGADARVSSFDLRPLQTLLTRIEEKYHPEQVWLFGSRARRDAEPESDWDLFVVVSDDADERDLDPRVAWRLQRGSGVYADVIPCRATDFQNARDTVN